MKGMPERPARVAERMAQIPEFSKLIAAPDERIGRRANPPAAAPADPSFGTALLQPAVHQEVVPDGVELMHCPRVGAIMEQKARRFRELFAEVNLVAIDSYVLEQPAPDFPPPPRQCVGVGQIKEMARLPLRFVGRVRFLLPQCRCFHQRFARRTPAWLHASPSAPAPAARTCHRP